jgi:hypothetical protein
MVVLAFLSDPDVVRKILGHLRLPTTAPALAPARLFSAAGTLGRALGFALPEEDVVLGREEGDDAGDSGTPEPVIRRALEGGPPP